MLQAGVRILDVGRPGRWLALVLALTACEAKDGAKDGAKDDATPGGKSGGEAADREAPIAVGCTMGDALEAPARTAVIGAAREVLARLQSGDHGALFDALHPQARDPQGKAAFVEMAGGLQARLGAPPSDASAQPAAEELVVVAHVEGGTNDLARAVCRDGPDDGRPPALTMLVNAGAEDAALVSLVVPGTPYHQAVVVQLRRRGTQWRLLGLSVHPARYRDRSALDWAQRAEDLRRDGKAMPAWVALAIAQALADRGTSIETPLTGAIAADLERVASEPEYQSATGTWRVGTTDYPLHGLSLAATRNELSLVVRYQTPGPLQAEALDRDADLLMDHVRTTHGALEKVVDGIVFEAYDRAPQRAGASYDAYRTVRMF